eukprot:CAMPEP_0202894748 /NCGR_PEP_ID=MMETSP1392-20130828/4078_1 /ASSEMBLY_ACC=CAM_ASM_000868 /TAXON_ID=225041 /ORGANISM="Chlamydomonas chlamydogama, Strain SAG 11-48b" /LENGTH=172 /DNA_ID=CAMNT_0049579525 /DNA_START=270 /DNA_END=785 /DNA_ORIENTATION=-
MRPPARGGGGRGGFGGRGGGGRGGFGGRGGGRGYQDQGPPESVVEAGTYLHACEGEAVVKLTNEKIPYFNAPIYLENKTQIGKVEEILGSINNAHFTIKMADGVVATSYKLGDKFFIDPMKLLPLERFLPRPKGAPATPAEVAAVVAAAAGATSVAAAGAVALAGGAVVSVG